MDFATRLSNWIGMVSCLWPISFNAMICGIASFALVKPAPVSASWADDMMASRSLHTRCTGPLDVGGGEVGKIGNDGGSLRKK